MVGLGSGPPPDGWTGTWIALPRDDEPPFAADPTRGGAWHWLPSGHAGLSARMRAVAGWITAADPVAVISDVSCEVTCLAALLGVPTAHVLLHGDRTDRPHRQAFDTADVLVAPWPAAHAEPAHGRWAAKTRHVGLLSRFDGRPAPTGAGDGSVLVLVPGGPHPFRTSAITAAAAASGRPWVVAGAIDAPATPAPGVEWLGPVADPWPLLERASVVLSAAGAGAIGDIAAARRPAVLFPQPRPFDEQAVAARALATTAPVRILEAWPEQGWWALIDQVADLDGTTWRHLHDGSGAARFAVVAAALAAGS
ncbi:hypothetical protein KSP35_21415 [Aquihabitans sp. G128]|uniref:glycosyltransferase n=1 Tax=Aquihabitans sp. G128 TaxID=2849779 RepID=UPI001C24C9EF|nr:glycosyltransferase [Aquihabitans sp. G128]QXC60849.1 hypothetical protein KSP35_21415 [Aquihabitans sp. G128]